KIRGVDADRVRLAKERGVGWFLGMQIVDGGWASFDADNNRLYLNNIPFADHGALVDPSTEDLTGRGLELLGTLGYPRDLEAVDRAIHFIRRSQRHDGPWYGRWGVNYIYGTWSVLRGLGAIGVDPRHEYVQRAVRWLLRRQNPDGGWGETCESYAKPELAGIGESLPSQTAWPADIRCPARWPGPSSARRRRGPAAPTPSGSAATRRSRPARASRSSRTSRPSRRPGSGAGGASAPPAARTRGAGRRRWRPAR